MRLLTVGDSFTYGEELDDISDAWPYQLGNLTGYTVTNLAQPSKSNDYMVKTVVDHAPTHDIIIVAWSHYARAEYADEHGVFDIWPGNRGNMFLGDLTYRLDLIEYINRHHSDTYLYSNYLLNIILVQSHLKQLGKRYLMLDAFGNTIARNLDKGLASKIDTTNYLGWPAESMMEWTFGTSKGPRGHFLKEGHARVADKIYEHIRNLSWIS